ncbi:WD-40 repeat-containing protein, partial [Reticulomyxa filosa]
LEEKEVQLIIQHWIRMLHIRFGWIQDFDKLVVNYVMSSVLYSMVNKIFRYYLLLSFNTGSDSPNARYVSFKVYITQNFLRTHKIDDYTIRLWDIEENNEIQLFYGHSSVNCVKYSPYHYYNNSCTVICFSSNDKTIRFWDIKDDQQLRLLDGHTGTVCGIEFSPFNGGRYLCSGSCDNTIRLWDVETFKSLHAFNGHTSAACCVDISPLQSNNNNKNESSDIGVIGGNGYTICSGSWDKTIRIWDIETTKQTIVFKRHEGCVLSVKYGPNELGNIVFVCGIFDL